MYINQSGRSMIEMLGVLAIIGVLTVGGLSIIGKARRQQEITQTVSEISQLIESARKISCQYDEGYKNYVNFLAFSEAYPSQLEYKADDGCSENEACFVLSADMLVRMPFAKGNKKSSNAEEQYPHFAVAVSDMDDDTCMNLAAESWGTTATNGFVGMYFGSSISYSDLNYPQMDLGTAASNDKGCGSGSLYLVFRACDCTTCNADSE